MRRAQAWEGQRRGAVPGAADQAQLTPFPVPSPRMQLSACPKLGITSAHSRRWKVSKAASSAWQEEETRDTKVSAGHPRSLGMSKV